MVKLKKKSISSTKVSQQPKPVVFTGNKPLPFDDLEEWSKKIKIQILYSKVRANKKELRKKYSNFDKWFKEVEKQPLIEEHRKDYLKYLKKIKNTNKLFKDLQKEIISEPVFSEDNPPKNYDNSPIALAYKLNKISADAMGMTVADYLIDRRKRIRALYFEKF